MSPRRRPGPSLRSLGQWVRPRRWRLVGLSLGLLCLFILWVVETHATRSVAPLGVAITVVALVALIGAGNLLEGWMGIKHRSPEYTERDQRPEDTTAP